MIVGVRGVLEAVGPDWVHLQVGGVTLQVSVPAATVAELGSLGETVHLFTHLLVRDEQPQLYGFASPAALQLFLSTLAVTGVGPRLSLALLSSLGVARLTQAIGSGDIGALSSVPGIGRRIAGRIVLELKGKLDLESPEAAPPPAEDDGEIVAALTALGYSANEVRRVVGQLDAEPGATLEDRIRLALRQFGGG